MKKVLNTFLKSSRHLLVMVNFWVAVTLGTLLGLGIMSPLFAYKFVMWLNTPQGEAYLMHKVSEQISERSLPLSIGSIDVNVPDFITISDVTYDLAPNDRVAISSIKLDFTDFIAGHVAMKGRALSYDIGFESDFDWQGVSIALANAKVSLPQLKITGDFSYDIVRSQMSGNAKGMLSAIEPYMRYTGAGHNLSPVTFGAVFEKGLLAQKAELHVNTKSYRYDGVDLSLYDIDFDAFYNGDTLFIKRLNAKDDEGQPVRLNGTYEIATQALDFSIAGDKLHILKGQPIDNIVDLDVTLKGNLSEVMIKGDVNSKKMQVTLPERFTSEISSLNIENEEEYQEKSRAGLIANLDLKFNALKEIYVRGWGLDAEFGGALEVKGTKDNPLVYGQLKMLRGRYEDFGRRFQIERAILRFNGPVPPSPELDIIASTEIDDVTATIKISGPARQPKVSFSSSPTMPEDEVFSYILFGQSKSKLSPFQLVQLTQSLARLAGKGGAAFDPVASIRDAAGLDDLRIGMDDNGGATVGAGKYIADGVYLELETGAQAGATGASVEVEIGEHFSLESKLGQDANAGAGVFWKWDY